MAELSTSRTYANLLRAFASEAMASRRYLRYAAVAEQEDRQPAAALFRYMAKRRQGHAEAHLQQLDALEGAGMCQTSGATLDHLRAAIINELHEHAAWYPGMACTARDEGFDEIADWFETLAKASRSHTQRFQQALDTVTQSGPIGFGT